MKKKLFYQLLLFSSLLLVFSCNTKREDEIGIFKLKTSQQECNDIGNFNKFLHSHNLSIHFNNYSFRLIDNEFIISAFSVDLKELFIYNATKDSVLEINLLDKDMPHQPIISLYVQSYDSIFVLFNNINLAEKRLKNKGNTELVLFDNQMNVIHRYNLDKIPYFFKSGDKSLVENNILNYQSRVFNGKLLFPMTIYSPAPSNSDFYEFNPDVICFIDINSGAIQTLNAKFPYEDIGKVYDKRTSITDLRYYILNKDSILYSFPYSPAIYLLDVHENKSKLLNKFDDFPFQNTELGANYESKVFKFGPLVFSETQKIFVRRIGIEAYKNKNPTYIIQVLDQKLNHIGFIKKENDADYYISCIGKDIYIGNKRKNTCFNLILDDIQQISISDFEKIYLKDQEIIKKGDKATELFLPIEQRYKMYLKDIGIEDAKKIVIINTDLMCSSCIDYLMASVEKYQNRFDSLQIRYLFIGSDIDESIKLISNYNVLTHVYFDKTLSYKKYFSTPEILNYHLITNKNDVILIDSADFQNFFPKINTFLKIP